MSKMQSATFTTRDRNADPMNLQASPEDPELKLALRERLNQLSYNQLSARLTRQIHENRVTSAARSGRDLGMITRILDVGSGNGGGTTGNYLPRVDLEQTIYSLNNDWAYAA